MKILSVPFLFNIMIVILAEKPKVAQKIAEVLRAKNKANGYFYNDQYIVTFAYGHLITTKTPEEIKGAKIEQNELPYIPDEIAKKPSKGAEDQLKIVVKLFNDKNTSSLICATDAGREGELIFRLIYDYANCKKTFKRLWISSITDVAIAEGMNNLKPGESFDNLSNSGKLRQDADWIVGFNCSIAISRKNGFPIKLGRVKTPTLFLVVKRFLENKMFKSQLYYQPTITVTNNKNESVVATLQDRILENDKLNLIVSKIKESGETELFEIEKKESKNNPPELFDLGGLQKAANIKFGITADEVLSTLQNLYESGFVSYPRTDSKYLSDDMEEKVWNLVDLLGEKFNISDEVNIILQLKNKRNFNNNKVTDHHAIIPEENIPEVSSLKEIEKKIYLLIVFQFLKSFHETSVKDITNYFFRINQIKEPFLAKGSVTKRLGWKVFDDIFKGYFSTQEKETDEIEADEDNLISLPIFMEGVYPITDLKSIEKYTQAPPLLTDASLLSLMENCGKEVEDEEIQKSLKDTGGIGTPATRAGIIKELIDSEYIVREKKKILPTQFGFEIIKSLNQTKIVSPSLTGEWENRLSQIENGDLEISIFKKEIKLFTNQIVSEILEVTPKLDYNPYQVGGLICPKCAAAKLIENKFYYYCEDNGCGFKLPISFREYKVSRKDLKLLLEGKPIKNAKMKSKEGKSYSANIIFDKSKLYLDVEFTQKPGGVRKRNKKEN